MYDPYNQQSNTNPAGEQPGSGPASQEPGTYRIVRPQSGEDTGYRRAEPERSYADARFIPNSDAPQMPRYSHAPQPEPQNKPPKASGGLTFGKVVALCLVCAILGGLAGLGGSLLLQGSAEEALVPMVTPGEAPAAAPEAAEPQPTTGSTPIVAAPTDTNALTGDAIYELACPQTVGISTEVTQTNIFGQTTSGAVTGSGFILTADGYILTNYHVIKTAQKDGLEITVTLHNGETYPAEIVGFEDDGTDIAVLKIEASGLSAVSLGNSDEMRVGETIYALGNPLGELTYTLTSGMVSALDRVIATGDSEADSINMFQTDAAINSGNSGGPVFNARGQVIGVATAKYSDTGVEGLGFAIPINDAMDIATELIENGYVSGKAYFGITVTTVTSYAAQYYNMAEGAYIYALDPNSCAAEAGLQEGDVIVALDDMEITGQTDLVVAKRSYRAGDTAIVTVVRGKETLELPITFDEEVPASAQPTQPEEVPAPTAEVKPDDPKDGNSQGNMPGNLPG